VVVVAGVTLHACGGASPAGGSRRTLRECGPAPTALSPGPELPPNFPTPEGVVYTGVEQAGPTTIVHGFVSSDLETTFEAYKRAFSDAGFHVTRDEIEDVDAEVNWAGGGADGQVKLLAECEGRLSVRITVRPV
jgi:hypothetical protein